MKCEEHNIDLKYGKICGVCWMRFGQSLQQAFDNLDTK